MGDDVKQSGSGRKRGSGEGTGPVQRPDGRWQARIELPKGLDGRRRRKYVYGATRNACARKLNRYLGRLQQGELLRSSSPTVAAWLDLWLETHRDEWTPATLRSYRQGIAKLKAVFGPVRLEQLTAMRLQQWIADEKVAHGARRRVELAVATLRSALSHAKRLHVMAVNVAELVTLPTRQKQTIEPLTADQTRTLLQHARGDRLSVLLMVDATLGLRHGELLGLRWQDVDIDAGLVHVRQQLQRVERADGTQVLDLVALKTKRSRRTLQIPAALIGVLKTHRVAQLEQRLKAGARWVDRDFVFSSRTGTPLMQRNVRRSMKRLLAATGLPAGTRIHDLRHGVASMLLEQGVDVANVSLVLGHSGTAITGTLYSHLTDGARATAATMMDGVLSPAAKAGGVR